MKKVLFFILVYTVCIGLKSQTAGFTYTQTSACAPATFSFTNTSTGSISSYSWDFGDGFTSNVLNPTHPYTAAGTYTVSLTVSFQDGSTRSETQSIQIFTPPAFTFTKLNDSLCPGEAVQFRSSITSSIAVQSYSWDFGDGGSSTAANPLYTYVNPSNLTTRYPVSLTVTDVNGCSHKETINNYIYVKQKPMPEFDADQRMFCFVAGTPATVNFINQTTATSNNTYLWQFGTPPNSTDENPTRNYNSIGNYSVSLTATSDEGCTNTISKTAFIQVTEYNITFSVSDTILCSVPATVSFQGGSSLDVEYYWDFGDGATGTSLYYPFLYNKRYSTSGTYTARAIGVFDGGKCSDTGFVVIHVYDSIKARMDEYDSLNYVCKPFYPFGFKDRTPYSSTDDFGFGSIVWDFGNNITAVGDSVYHTFPDYGEHEVILSVTTPYGCTLKDTSTIISIHPWYVRGGLFPDSGSCVPFRMALQKFTIHSSTNVDFIIDWGDGDSSYTNDVLFRFPKYSADIREGSNFIPIDPHTYYDTNEYVVTSTATNEQGCVIFDTVMVFKGGMPPKIGARYTYVEDCFTEFWERSKLTVVAFDSLDSEGKPIAGVRAEHWTWMGIDHNGHIASEDRDSIQLMVDRLGYFSVRAYGSHNGCEGDTITLDSIAFVCPPIGGFSPSDTTFCKFPAEVQFRNNSTLATSYQWYFGDAELLSEQSTSTDYEPSFEYTLLNDFVLANATKYGVRPSLIAYNDDSLNVNSPTYNKCGFCTDTIRGSIRIANPQSNFVYGQVCERSDFTFYDRSTSRPGIVGWKFFLESHDPSHQEVTGWYPPRWMWPPFVEGGLDSSSISPNIGETIHFDYANTYTAYFFNVDSFFCQHGDTVTFSVTPQSTPVLASGKDPLSITLSKDTLCANFSNSIYLRDSSYTIAPFDTAKIIQWKWAIGSDTSIAEEPVFANLPEGVLDVYMQIINEYGCVADSLFAKHLLNRRLKSVIGLPSNKSFCNHTSIEFGNNSFYTPVGNESSLVCTWDFGDGSPLYTCGYQNVSHTYHIKQTLPCSFYVTLTVSSPEGDCYDTFVDTVVIVGPIASFTDNGHRFPCPDLGRKIQFTNTSTGNPTAYHWNFGDTLSGNTNESYLKDPLHDYLQVGEYDITLIVSDNIGCRDTVYKPKYVFIDGPVGSFDCIVPNKCDDYTAIFIPTILNADSIIINPDRATMLVRTGNDLNDTILYTYPNPGTYIPYFYLVKWTDNNGNPEHCVVEWASEDTIHLLSLTPDFDVDTVHCSNDPISLVNTSQLSPSIFTIDSLIWDFGNGNTLHNKDTASIQYSTNGTYTITLHVFSGNCHKQVSKEIEVLSFPEILIDLETMAGCDTLEFDFLAKVGSGNTNQVHFMWTFWDGETSSANPTKRTFDTSGYYRYRLEAFLDEDKCSKVFEDSIYLSVYTSPVADFDAQPQPANFGDPIQFTDLSLFTNGNIVDWNWDFGDNTYANEQHPSHTYETSGRLTVKLHIADEFGCVSDKSLEILILESLEFANILTPVGSNGQRYVFRPLEETGYYKEFKIHIYNKWGTLIWSNTCKEPNCPDYSDAFWWDGRNTQGKPVEDGVYYWVVSAVPLSETTLFVKNGSVTVFHSR
jgi:PKD repeat protein